MGSELDPVSCLADENGVLCVPRARIRDVLGLAERIEDQERKLECR